MEFIKKFFDDDAVIIGLCGFNCTKPNYKDNFRTEDNFLEYFNKTKTFETKFSENVLLF